MKKLLAILLAAMMLVATMAPAMAEGTTTLTIAGWDIASTPYFQAIKEAYEASHPGVTIQYVDMASQDYNIKATTELSGAKLAGKDTTDLYLVKELSDMQNWANEELIQPLDDAIATYNMDMSKYAGMDKCYIANKDGKYYALPYRADFWVLFYNKTLFEQAGLELPTNDMTWDAYAEAARAITDKTGAYGSHYHTWLSAAVNWAVCDGVNTLADGKYDDLAYFYNLLQGLEDDGVVMTYDELKALGLHYSGAFAQGNIAMMPMGYWYVATLISYFNDGTAKDFEWGITAVPHLEGVAAGSSFGSPTGIAVTANTQQPELAKEFAAWLCSEEGAKVMASTGNRPAYASEAVAKVLAAAPGFPSDETSLGALTPSAISLEWPIGEGVNEIKTIVNEEHTLIMTRECTVEEGIAKMEERAAEYIK